MQNKCTAALLQQVHSYLDSTSVMEQPGLNISPVYVVHVQQDVITEKYVNIWAVNSEDSNLSLFSR